MKITGSSPFPPALLEKLSQRDPADPLKILPMHGSHTGAHRSAASSLTQALNELPDVQSPGAGHPSASCPTCSRCPH